MQLIFKSNLDGVVWDQVSDLFEAVGWGRRSPESLEEAFCRSSHVRMTYDNDKLVGCGRTVDDGKYYALIVDLIVHPDYQAQGIGSRILCELKDGLEEFLFTTLTAAVGKDDFYVRQGWRKQKSAFIWPRSKRQEELHAEGG